MKEKLRTINVLNHVFSIPQTAVYNLRAIDAVYECGTVDHDLHISTDEIELEHVIALFDAVIEGDRISRAVKQAEPSGRPAYPEAKAEAEEAPRASITFGDVHRLALQPGDTIVLTPTDTMSDVAAKRLAKDVMAATGGRKVLILEPGMMIGTMGVDMGKPISFANLASAKAGAEIPLSPGDGAERAGENGKRSLKEMEELIAETRIELQRVANESMRAMVKASEAGIPKSVIEVMWAIASEQERP